MQPLFFYLIIIAVIGAVGATVSLLYFRYLKRVEDRTKQTIIYNGPQKTSDAEETLPTYVLKQTKVFHATIPTTPTEPPKLPYITDKDGNEFEEPKGITETLRFRLTAVAVALFMGFIMYIWVFHGPI